MKHLYCDSCLLISLHQVKKLELLSRYKNQFFISKTQIFGELIKPDDLASKVIESISVIENDRDEIILKTKEFISLYKTLSFYDCLCMAYAFLDGYCLITDDKALIKKCKIHHIEVKTSNEIIKEFLEVIDLR